MGWVRLQEQFRRESDLQDFFTSRQDTSDLSAGAPEWLVHLKPEQQRSYKTALGNRFTPDVVGRSGTDHYVIELKSAFKYEPLALPEVLHHAWMLQSEWVDARDRLTGTVIPAIITQYSPWLRGALAWLGVRTRDLRYLECTRYESDDMGTIVRWFEQPFGTWERRQDLIAQARCPVEISGVGAWYFEPDTGSWYGFADAFPGDIRPLFFLLRPIVMLSPTQSKSDGANGCAVWHLPVGGAATAWLWQPGRIGTDASKVIALGP